MESDGGKSGFINCHETEKYSFLNANTCDEAVHTNKKLVSSYDAVFGDGFSNWIIPCNVDNYDIFSAFKKHDEIEWHYTPQTQKIRVGDKVYLYVGKPYSRIMYECDVVKTNILAREINDNEFIKNEFAFGDAKYFRIKRLRKIEDLNLSMSALNNHGIKGNIQGARRLEKETVEYIEKVVSSDSLQSNVEEVVDDISFIAEEEIEAILNAKDDTACYVYKVDVVKLRKLNQKQIDKLKGLYKGQCQLCGQNIGKEYGKEIVEAHHIEPFSKTQNNHPTNIVILCPNCHALMHKCNPVYNVQNHTFDFGNGIIKKLKIEGHLE